MGRWRNLYDKIVGAWRSFVEHFGMRGTVTDAWGTGDEHRILPRTRSRRDRSGEKTTGERAPAANAKEGGRAVDVKAYHEQVTPLESL